MDDIGSSGRVAVIGSGPGGLVAARYLKAHGFTPVIFERNEEVGGQWSCGAEGSFVWPTMVANTSREMTCFSDLAHPPGTPVFPSNQQVLGYLRRYARQFGLLDQVRTRTEVVRLDRGASGYQIVSTGPDGQRREETFERVIVAVGREQKPNLAALPGIEGLAREGGVSHSSDYRGPERFRGKRVLVCGSSISAVELASELALGGAARVVSAGRCQKYVLQKFMAGIPADQLAFNRFSALAMESFPPEVAAHGFKALLARFCGLPEMFGALPPPESVFAAGITQSQNYLPLVGEGRIIPQRWPTHVEGNTVHFPDGSQEQVDAILFATGFRLSLPFLSERLSQVLGVDEEDLDLHHFTFHPELPGLAFLGLYCLAGPHLPVFELQARAITYAWRGMRPIPSPEEMRASMAADRARRGRSAHVPMPPMALLFARDAGVEPDLAARPDLLAALMFGPMTPSSFRISGPDALPDAAERTLAAARAVHAHRLSAEQRAQLEALAQSRRDEALARACVAAAGLESDVELRHPQAPTAELRAS